MTAASEWPTDLYYLQRIARSAQPRLALRSYLQLAQFAVFAERIGSPLLTLKKID